jgi:hypothetical protein
MLNKDELNEELTKKHIYLDDNIKWDNQKMVKLLGDNYLKEHREEWTFGVAFVQAQNNFMLCKHYKDEIKNFAPEDDPLTSDNWIAEVKKDDFRLYVVYDPEYGFELFSRRESVKTFLNSTFTDKVLFIKNGLVRQPKDFIGTFNYRFVLDCGITVNSDNTVFEGVDYSNAEDLLQAILGSLPERAKEYQKGGNSLVINGFDVLYFEKDPQPIAREDFPKFIYQEPEVTNEDVKWIQKNFENYLLTSGFVDKFGKPMPLNGKTKKLYSYLITLKDTSKYDVRKLPFIKRRKLRDSIITFLQANILPFVHIDSEDENKISFAEQIIREGGEGAILKNLNAPYISSMASSRSHKAMLKVKQNVTQLLANMDVNEDFDVFISGSNPPKSKRIKDMIGAVKCSVYVENEDGITEEHEIANVSGIPHEVKRLMTVVDEQGSITLNPEYLGKVIAINGMGLTHRNLRFSHAVLKDKDNDRLVCKPKNAIECTYSIDNLEAMVSIRGTR